MKKIEIDSDLIRELQRICEDKLKVKNILSQYTVADLMKICRLANYPVRGGIRKEWMISELVEWFYSPIKWAKISGSYVKKDKGGDE